jgi:hypothetical protein
MQKRIGKMNKKEMANRGSNPTTPLPRVQHRPTKFKGGPDGQKLLRAFAAGEWRSAELIGDSRSSTRNGP